MTPPGETTRLRMGWVVAASMFALIALPFFRGQVYVYCDLAYGYLADAMRSSPTAWPRAKTRPGAPTCSAVSS